MATGWVKSMQCKSRAYDDVYNSTSCRSSYQSLKDVVHVDHSQPKANPTKPNLFSADVKRSHSRTVKPKPKSKPGEKHTSLTGSRVRRTASAPITKGLDLGRVGFGPFFPSVVELAEGHPSRNVVEIIFHTRWGPNGFSARVEMVFKVHNPIRESTRFEDYRDLVKSRAGSGSGFGGRCVADGNEMMRFHCLGSDTCVGGGAMVKTYAGSGAAHTSGGGGKGRWAMVVCRVIAGRVSNKIGNERELGQFDSVNGENGELLVFDSRAILPCFLVIYKL